MKKRLFSLLLLTALLCGCSEAAPTPSAPPAVSGDGLTVHFIDVGQADCALLECGGEYMLIDGGNREDGQLVVSYLEQQGVEELSAVVCSHAHEDHVGGLPAVLAVYPTAAVYAPTRTYSSNVFDDFLYYTDQQGLEVTLPVPGDAFSLGETQVTVLGPVKSYADPNDTSIVLRVEYGEASFLFTGDMETTAENDMLDYWDDASLFRADVLKVGHHGSNTSTGYRFLYEVDPDYGVISVGTDNSYGHPHEEPVSRMKDAGVTMLRTDELGHILASTDGQEITFTWGNQNAQPEDVEPGDPQPQTFIGNRNSKKLHTPDCTSLPKEENRVYFDNYQQALEEGYSPCGSCLE
ncbi:MAG: MBL fold metallo-hydrolase [Oscillospiraceae bacterium]|nr:MBL fold metallo-hydrolase [Oscillospiraceae bacterium]